ncbi:FAD-dependent monooxygenase [Caballeronia sp.]|uniref:FAD binding domain-containing protein n=1 Tax=Caballeronia sp. TaxID=1931223 RepID=UPI003C609E62
MTQDKKAHAIIIGGSLSGLFSATALRAIGYSVDVFEQSPNELDSRGGGIVLQPDVLAAFKFAGVDLPAHSGVDSGDRIYLGQDDRIVEQFFMPQTQTSWSLIYNTMKQALPAGVVHAGERFTRFEQTNARVTAHFESGRVEEGDILIGADGPSSSVRAQLLPAVEPTYAGYIAWRGLVEENDLPAGASDLLRDRFTFQQGESHLILVYLVPGEEGAIERGKRRWNWVWYRKMSTDAVSALMLDRDGQQRATVLGQREIYALHAASRNRLNALYMTSIFIGGAVGSALASVLYEHGGWLWVAIAGTTFPALALIHFLLTGRSTTVSIV